MVGPKITFYLDEISTGKRWSMLIMPSSCLSDLLPAICFFLLPCQHSIASSQGHLTLKGLQDSVLLHASGRHDLYINDYAVRR